MAEFLLEVEVIRAQRKSMLDSLKKMQEVSRMFSGRRRVICVMRDLACAAAVKMRTVRC